MSPSMYGNLWKMDGPTETCEEQTLEKTPDCGDEVRWNATLHHGVSPRHEGQEYSGQLHTKSNFLEDL